MEDNEKHTSPAQSRGVLSEPEETHQQLEQPAVAMETQSPDIQSPQTKTGLVPQFMLRNKMLINIQINIMFVTCPVSCLFVFF